MDGDRGETSQREAWDDADRRSRRDDAPDEPEESARTDRRRRVGFIAGGIALCILAVAGTLYWLHARHYESTDDAFIDGNTTQMAAQVSGRVTALLFADNRHVDAGQTLVEIDPRDFQARLEQAKGQQANAAAQLAQANAQVAVQQASLDQAQANVRVAQADQVQAHQDQERYTALGPHAVTQQQIDNATAALRSSNAKLDAARQAVGGAQATLLAGQAQVLAARASVQEADANAAAAALQLSYCTITAPVSGRVTHRTVEVGNYINAGQALFALVQDDLWVTANFKETQLDSMRPGAKVDIAVDAFPGTHFSGHVDSFQAGSGSAFSVLPAENATGNYVKVVQRVPVKILFDTDTRKEALLAPGLSVVPTVTVR